VTVAVFKLCARALLLLYRLLFEICFEVEGDIVYIGRRAVKAISHH